MEFPSLPDDEDKAAADILIEFLEVAVHNILYVRKLYPSTIFVCRKKYDVPVQKSTHPQLNEYISKSLNAVKELLKKNEVSRVVVAFADEHSQPIERFVMDILHLSSKLSGNDPYFIKGEEAFRSFCLKLAVIGSNLKPLPEGSTFTILMYTTEMASVSLAADTRFQEFPWTEIDDGEVEISNGILVPIKTMDTDYLKLQMYAEESTVK